MTRSLLTLLLLTALVGLLSGCNDTHMTLSGNVTVSGQPLSQGQIEFTPVDGSGTPVGAPIVAGKYTARMLPGEKTVVIAETLDIPVPKSTEELQRAAGQPAAPRPVSKIKPDTKGNSTKVKVSKATKTLDFPLEP